MYFSQTRNESYPLPSNMFIRFIVCEFLHANFIHLTVNLFSWYQFKVVKEQLGARKFLCVLLYFILACPCIEMVLAYFFVFSEHVGFSGVLFGFLTYLPPSKIYWIKVSPTIAPLLLVIAAGTNVPNSSFVGHIAGASLPLGCCS